MRRAFELHVVEGPLLRIVIPSQSGMGMLNERDKSHELDPDHPRQDHIEERMGERRQKQSRCLASQEIHPKDLHGEEPEHQQPIALELPTERRAALLPRKENVTKVKADEIAVPGAKRRAIELFQKSAPARQPIVFLLGQRREIRCFPRRLVPPWWSVL